MIFPPDDDPFEVLITTGFEESGVKMTLLEPELLEDDELVELPVGEGVDGTNTGLPPPLGGLGGDGAGDGSGAGVPEDELLELDDELELLLEDELEPLELDEDEELLDELPEPDDELLELEANLAIIFTP